MAGTVEKSVTETLYEIISPFVSMLKKAKKPKKRLTNGEPILILLQKIKRESRHD